MEIAYLIIGLLAGAAIGFLVGRKGQQPTDNEELEKLRKLAYGLESSNEHLAAQKDDLTKRVEALQSELTQTGQQLASARTHFKDQENRIAEQKKEFEELNKRFNMEFENLANRILDEKSKKFTDQNKENMETVLKPLRDRIKEFEQKVEKHYDSEQKERASLKGEIKVLHELNQKISEEAHNLTTALKGDTKKQGNWGEMILERILESSGLLKGQEYTTQETVYNDEGQRLQPDVVIQLPEDKHIVIDSKVSLVAYERFVNADSEEEQQRWLKAHVSSVKTHVKELSGKNYQSTAGINSPEFVLMFMPIESSFSVSVRADEELFNYAWEHRIVIVSPSTLLATLRTVSSIWKQERQTQNAITIAKKSGQLYNKFVSFVEDMQKIGEHLERAQKSHGEGIKRLSEGRGNLINRASELKKMGVKASKELPKDLIGNEEFDNEEDA